MFFGESSYVVIGADFPTARAASRRAEIDRCIPGEVVELRRERVKIEGRRAIGVYSCRGFQIGYLYPDSIENIIGLLSLGNAIFQTAEVWGAVIRARFDGRPASMPPPKPKPERRAPPREPVDEYCDIFPLPRCQPSQTLSGHGPAAARS